MAHRSGTGEFPPQRPAQTELATPTATQPVVNRAPASPRTAVPATPVPTLGPPIIINRPANRPYTDAPPRGATAQCFDGTYSFTYDLSACTGHGGVGRWLVNRPAVNRPSAVVRFPLIDGNGKQLRAICKDGSPSYWQGDRAFTCLMKGGVIRWFW